jgi:hypothetical protein
VSDDDWQPVNQPAPQEGQPQDEWQPVALADRPAPVVGEALPEAFMDRVRAGQALGRIAQAAVKGATDTPSDATPTGFSDETLQHLSEYGIFHDPARGRPGPIQFANEAIMTPVAQAWQAITGAVNAGIHGAGGAMEQLVSEFGGSQGTADRAKNEVINFANWAMIEGGQGQFSRPTVENGAVVDRTVGGLPTPQDFTNAAKVLAPKEPLPISVVRNDDNVVGTKGLDVFYGSRDNPQGQIIGNINGNSIQVKLSTLGEESRGQGVGVSMYEHLLKYADENGFKVESDSEVSADAARVYDALERRGYNVERNPDVTTDADGKIYANSGSVFQVSGKAPDPILQNLRRMWNEDGIHPAEAVHDAQSDAFLKHDIVTPHEEIKPDLEAEELLTETGGAPGSLSAAATSAADVPLDVQPASPPSSLVARAKQAADTLFDVGKDIQMKLTPMARGSIESMATVKDYMNSMRRNAWDWSRTDSDLMKRFTPEQRARMWNAMDEESLSLRLGEPASAREHQGLATLEPDERAAVVDLDTRQQLAWLKARDLGMVEGDGIAMHAPRMVVNAKKASDREGAMSLTALGYDLRTRTPGMRQRKYMEVEETERAAKAKYGEEATVARDIRTVALGTSQLEDAIAGRALIDNIKDVGKRTGSETVAEGFKPDDTWFTVDHPAFKTYRPKFQDVDGKIEAIKDANGNPVFEQVPIYVRGDFEGPLRAAMWGKSGAMYKGMMGLKGKTMGLIMNSPMIHNLVEFGRAFPAMPTRIVKAYFDGNRAKNDPSVMHEAIDAGLVPIGKRFFNQDITTMMETPDLTPGRSFTAKVLAAVPGLFDEGAGTAVKQAIDKAGDFWHNTLLWDRIADLQMGLYTNFRGDMLNKGMDTQTASRVAAHLANRYAGALPKEAMSEMATKVSNFMFFSRSFTFGNLGVMKDMLTGLPKDVLAQIERDAGFKAGEIEGAGKEGAVQQAVTSARSAARRKAMMTVGLDVALMFAGNSILQNAFNVMLGDSTLSQEGHEYIRRARDLLNDPDVHPLSLLNPFFIASRLSATADNEPSRQDRVRIGYAKDGTAIYARNPVGKIGEEFSNWFSSPLDMLKKKEGTIARPLLQILNNDAGFGRKIYDPSADTPAKYANSIWAIAKHLVGSQLPEGQLGALSDLVHGEGDKKISALQLLGPLAGVTFSKGAPGGPAVGEMYAAREAHDFAVNQALPDIRKQILRGDIPGATRRMNALGIPSGLQRFYVRTTLNPATRLSPRSLKDFYQYATPGQQMRMDRLREPAQP